MLIIRHIRHWYEPRIPHMVFLDGLYAGMLKDDRLQLNAPRGKYELKVQFGGRVPIVPYVKKLPVAVSIAQRRTKDIVATFNNLSNSIEPQPIQKKSSRKFHHFVSQFNNFCL